MTLQEWISSRVPDLEIKNYQKVSKFESWFVTRPTGQFTLHEFTGIWSTPMEDWVVIQHPENKGFKSIGFYIRTFKSKDPVVYFDVRADPYDTKWITKKSLPILRTVQDGMITLRGLHYKMVGLGMINSMIHYKRVVSAMIEARRSGSVPYAKFRDQDREMQSTTGWEHLSYDSQVETAKQEIEDAMQDYFYNRWDKQNYYPELWIEKLALVAVFERPCRKHRIALAACKGYPSLTFLYEASKRFKRAKAQGKKPILLYFGDYDPSGEDIPRAIEENMFADFSLDIEVRRVALSEEMVVEYNLPPAPVKAGDTRSLNWDGIGQVELDALDAEVIEELIDDEVDSIFDDDAFEDLKEEFREAKPKFVSELKEYVRNLDLDNDEEDEDDE